jgi:hypothetical protein
MKAKAGAAMAATTAMDENFMFYISLTFKKKIPSQIFLWSLLEVIMSKRVLHFP